MDVCGGQFARSPCGGAGHVACRSLVLAPANGHRCTCASDSCGEVDVTQYPSLRSPRALRAGRGRVSGADSCRGRVIGPSGSQSATDGGVIISCSRSAATKLYAMPAILKYPACQSAAKRAHHSDSYFVTCGNSGHGLFRVVRLKPAGRLILDYGIALAHQSLLLGCGSQTTDGRYRETSQSPRWPD